MEGQIISFAFIVLLVAGVVVGYIFYNAFYGSHFQIQILNLDVIDAIRNLIEDLKDYLGLSLTYSSHQALREHACKSGEVGTGPPWICNGPNPVTVEQSKACLQKYTQYYMDVYLSLFNTSLPLELLKTNFTDCTYGVDSAGVFAGQYDEGDFWVNCSGVKITITSANINELEKVNRSDYITRNRYWYLFRNFFDWAQADVYSKCICQYISCSCGVGVPDEKCNANDACDKDADYCANLALKDLQSRFDKNVSCETHRGCCAEGNGPPCGNPPGCQGWETHICPTKCVGQCAEPPPPTTPVCPLSTGSGPTPQSYSASPKSSISDIYSKTVSYQGFDWCHYEARFAATYEYKCVDQKYYVPSYRGPVPLTFTTYAEAAWKDPWACCTECYLGCGC